MRTSIIGIAAVIGLSGAAPAANGQLCCLAGDVNVDFRVDVGDVGPFVAVALDPAGATPRARCGADCDRDGDVDGEDVGAFIALLMDPLSGLFDYGPPRPNAEAEQIGLEMLGPAGPLRVPDAVYDRIDRDLVLIRAFEPRLGPETHSGDWLANHLIVKVWQGVPRDDYRCLNAYYRVTSERLLFSSGGGDWYVLTFFGNLNAPALASIYQALPEVDIAEPDGLIGGENFWRPMEMPGGPVWRWDIDDGFWDCFDGCDCHRYYVIDVDLAGTVTLISYNEVGMPWCEF